MSAPAVDISIIVATLNARGVFLRNLDAIYRLGSRHSLEVWVVDDGSVDGTADMVATQFPQAHLLVNPRNIGYAYSCNRAIERASGRFIHLLNNDVELLPGALDALVDFFHAHPDAGAAGSLLLNEDGSLQQSAKALPTLRSALFGGRSWLTAWMPNNRFTRRELQHWRAEAGVPFTTGYVSGASMMVPRDVLDRIGELDERMFYFNDADFCKRIWDVGRSVYCVPGARSIHLNHQGGSLKSLQRRLWALLIFHRGAYLYSRKHSGYPAWHPHQIFVLACLGGRLFGAACLQFGREISRVRIGGRTVADTTPPTAAPIAVSVITVNWNVRDLLLKAIASVFESAGALPVEMIVVDNASRDGSADLVQARFPAVTVIRNAGNPGYAHANNQGTAVARGRYVLFLNPDTRVIGDAIPAMVRAMDADASIGVLGAKLLRHNLRWSRDNGFRVPTIRTVLNEYLQLSRVIPVPWLFPGILRSRDFAGLDECEWVSGAALMMPRELALVQPWNEEIFFFAEDVEICDRVRRRGLRVVALADAHIVHYSGQSMIQQDEKFLADRVSATKRLLGERAHPAAVWLALRIIQGSLLVRSHAHRIKFWFNGDPRSLEKSRRLKQYLGLERSKA